MKNKLLILFFTIITFGIFLIPKTFAYYSPTLLDNINLVKDIKYIDERTINVYINRDDFDTYSSSVFLGFQLFNADTLDSVTPSSVTNTIQYTNNSWQYAFSTSMSGTGNKTGVRTGSISNTDIKNENGFIRVLFNQGISAIDYVFNVLVANSSNGLYMRGFVPNTYYDLGGFNDRGSFQYFSTYLLRKGLQNNEPIDTSSTMIGYNNIQVNSYYDTILNTNQINNGYYYYLKLDTNNNYLKNMQNCSIKYLECIYITINGVRYDYASAKQNFSWINRNITFYNDNASLFVSASSIVGYEYSIINSIEFDFINYDYAQSSYYNSSIGYSGYLKNCSISTMSVSALDSYNRGVNEGINTGYNNGYNEGYNTAMSERSSSFDNLVFSVANTPMTIITSMLNFEILGFNLMSFFMGIITLILFIHILRKFKE